MIKALTEAQRKQSDLSGLEDRQQQRHRSVQGQRRARLRRRSGGGALPDAQKQQLLDLIEQYVEQHGRRPRAGEDGRSPASTSTTRTSPGSAAPTNESVFYYRIHSPVILIEFDHQAAGRPAASAAIRKRRTGSTSTSSSARRTAMITARIYCASITRSTSIRTKRRSLLDPL